MASFKLISIIQLLKTHYVEFYKFTRQDRNITRFGILTIIIVVVSNTAMIWLMGNAINDIQTGEYTVLYQTLFYFVVIVLINQLMQMASAWILSEICLRFIGRCRNAILTKSLKLSFPIISKMSKGDILARLSNDIDLISQVLVTARLMLVSHVLTLGIYLLMLFWINTGLALIALATVPLYLLHQRYFSPRKQQATQEFLFRNAQLLSYEEQCLSNLRGISSNVAESTVSNKHQFLFNVAKKYAMRERVLTSGFGISFMLINYLVGLIIILFGVMSIHQGVLTVGALLSFILYLGYLTIPIRGITEIYLQCAGNTAAATRVSEILNTEQQTKESAQPIKLDIKNADIEFSHVSFSYLEEQIILADVNLELEANKTYALVGPSGSGKSSLINLLMRFYDPDKGYIKIDGIDIRDVSLSSLRSSIAVVWQDNFHINETVKENLLLANNTATSQQIISACKAANAWEFIEQLPQGIDTRLGSNGVSLSGGQYQRLAITQAFLKNAKIIVLDEASSALDSQSEQIILNSLERLYANRTMLIIAHRYSSIQNADHIIYFNPDGRVIVGQHQELYEQVDDYRDAVNWQTTTEIP